MSHERERPETPDPAKSPDLTDLADVTDVTGAAQQFAQPVLAVADRGAGDRTGAGRRAVALGEGLVEPFQFLDRRREIGVGDRHAAAAGGGHAEAEGLTWRAGGLVLAPQPHDGALRETVEKLVGAPGRWVDGVWVWDLHQQVLTQGLAQGSDQDDELAQGVRPRPAPITLP
ncbi:hypothetical protein GCM10022233_41280 [Streptomyces shaanxiensis]|uniref:Uncharacterized protein n=1 Tax=Streptomyces shaanxiensis TaxID=653357 RepID=A0ABP7VAH8_9ACTN